MFSASEVTTIWRYTNVYIIIIIIIYEKSVTYNYEISKTQQNSHLHCKGLRDASPWCINQSQHIPQIAHTGSSDAQIV